MSTLPSHYTPDQNSSLNKTYCNLDLQQTPHIRRLTNECVPLKMRYLRRQPIPHSKPPKRTRNRRRHVPRVKRLNTHSRTRVNHLWLLFDVKFIVVESVAYLASLLCDPAYQLHCLFQLVVCQLYNFRDHLRDRAISNNLCLFFIEIKYRKCPS